MRKIKLLDLCEGFTVSVGVSGVLLIFLGGGSCFLGLSGKAIDKLAQSLKPHQAIAQQMVNYGAGGAFLGLALTGSAVFIAKTAGEKLADQELQKQLDLIDQEGEQRVRLRIDQLHSTPNPCSGCIYYSSNGYLQCAVNPDLPKDCQDFTAQ
ncbi:hypothetical protein [Anabaena sp. CCY 9910]|uniref:hypothetical protein n=1 Tax=Anabaena sp. CCY 9910 TaxID=3103870 RepID=UPI0039E0EEAC